MPEKILAKSATAHKGQDFQIAGCGAKVELTPNPAAKDFCAWPKAKDPRSYTSEVEELLLEGG